MRRLAFALFAAALVSLTAADAMASALDLGVDRPARRRWVRSRSESSTGLKDLTIIRAHVGLSAPIGNFGDRYSSGVGFGGSIGYGVSDNAVISGSISHHHFDHDVFSNFDVGITPVTVNADFALPTGGRAVPWVGLGAGVYHVAESVDLGPTTVTTSENNFGVNMGIGFGAPISPRTLFGAGMKLHYVAGDQLIDTPFFTFQMGFGFIL